MDREKVIKAYENFVNGYECFCTSDDIEYEMHKAVLALLKEQEELGEELTNAVEFIHKKNERIEKLLKEKEYRHILEVHNIGNVDIPEGVSEEHFHLVMNNVVEALQHTDKGESYPYEDTGR